MSEQKNTTVVGDMLLVEKLSSACPSLVLGATEVQPADQKDKPAYTDALLGLDYKTILGHCSGARGLGCLVDNKREAFAHLTDFMKHFTKGSTEESPKELNLFLLGHARAAKSEESARGEAAGLWFPKGNETLTWSDLSGIVQRTEATHWSLNIFSADSCPVEEPQPSSAGETGLRHHWSKVVSDWNKSNSRKITLYTGTATIPGPWHTKDGSNCIRDWKWWREAAPAGSASSQVQVAIACAAEPQAAAPPVPAAAQADPPQAPSEPEAVTSAPSALAQPD